MSKNNEERTNKSAYQNIIWFTAEGPNLSSNWWDKILAISLKSDALSILEGMGKDEQNGVLNYQKSVGNHAGLRTVKEVHPEPKVQRLKRNLGRVHRRRSSAGNWASATIHDNKWAFEKYDRKKHYNFGVNLKLIFHFTLKASFGKHIKF